MRIAHLGPGSFFRAHTAWFTAHAGDGCEISAFAGRSGTSVAGLDGGYTLVTRAADGDRSERITVVTATSADRDDWLAWFADPELAVVTATVTEAGWADGGAAPALIAAGLDARAAAGLPGVAVVPCDNVPANGTVAARAVRSAVHDTDWLDAHVAFVATEVDRITPRPDDPAVVVTEPYAEWVLAGAFPAGRPRWEAAGARFVDDVEPFEQRKLWLLNGAHSILAYGGLARGHETVADAIADPVLHEQVERWWALAAPYLPMPSDDYRAALLERWANPRIHHRLAQIAADGSQKLPIRFGPVLRAELAEGRLPEPVVAVLAAWTGYLHSPRVDDVRVAELAGADAARAVELVGLAEPGVVDAVDQMTGT